MIYSPGPETLLVYILLFIGNPKLVDSQRFPPFERKYVFCDKHLLDIVRHDLKLHLSNKLSITQQGTLSLLLCPNRSYFLTSATNKQCVTSYF